MSLAMCICAARIPGEQVQPRVRVEGYTTSLSRVRARGLLHAALRSYAAYRRDVLMLIPQRAGVDYILGRVADRNFATVCASVDSRCAVQCGSEFR